MKPVTLGRDKLLWFRIELEYLRETLDFLEAQVASDVAAIEARLEELQPRVDHEMEEMEEDWSGEPTELMLDYDELLSQRSDREEHGGILRSALFLAAYATLEQCLDGLAQELRDARSIDVKPNDLRHQGIERSKVYLTKVVGMPFPSTGMEWSELCRVRAIRNQLAHEGPVLSAPPQTALQAALEAYPEIFSPGRQTISISRGFLTEVLGIMERFARQLWAHRKEFDAGPRIVP